MSRVIVLGKYSVALIFGLGLLGGCVTSYGGLTQETMQACIREAGITGSYSASSTLRNDRMTFIVYPGPNVTEAQSNIANACIARTIEGGQAGAPAPVAAPKSSSPAPAMGSSCQRGGGIMQGGTGYCTR
jgi:hypothetical protein